MGIAQPPARRAYAPEGGPRAEGIGSKLKAIRLKAQSSKDKEESIGMRVSAPS